MTPDTYHRPLEVQQEGMTTGGSCCSRVESPSLVFMADSFR